MTKPPCSPFSHISDTFPLVTFQQQISWPSKRTTNNRQCQTKDFAQLRRILKWLIATGLAISNQSTSFNIASSKGTRLELGTRDNEVPLTSRAIHLIPGQYTLLDRYINNPVQSTPVIPQYQVERY